MWTVLEDAQIGINVKYLREKWDLVLSSCVGGIVKGKAGWEKLDQFTEESKAEELRIDALVRKGLLNFQV